MIVLLIIILLASLIGYGFYLRKNAELNRIVEEKSIKLKMLNDIKKSIEFTPVRQNIEISKHYDNK